MLTLRVRWVLPITCLIILCGSTFVNAAEHAYSVPTNTTDPLLVEQGVREWLSLHPEYAGFRQVAVLRRMRGESGYHPCVSNGPHHDLLQWRDNRLRALYQSARVHPGTCPPWLAQIEFMDHEIHADPRFASFFRTRGLDAAYDNFSRVYLGGRVFRKQRR